MSEHWEFLTLTTVIYVKSFSVRETAWIDYSVWSQKWPDLTNRMLEFSKYKFNMRRYGKRHIQLYIMFQEFKLNTVIWLVMPYTNSWKVLYGKQTTLLHFALASWLVTRLTYKSLDSLKLYMYYICIYCLYKLYYAFWAIPFKPVI